MNEILRAVLWGAVFCHATAAAGGLAAALLVWKRAELPSRAAGWLAGFLGAAGLLLRTWETGHPPVVGDLENAMTFSWILALAALGRAPRSGGPALRAALLSAGAFLLLGWGLLQETSPEAMTSPYRSPWLAVHVVFFILAFGALGTAAAEGGRLLAGLGNGGREAEERMARFLAFGFAAETVGIAGGAIWAHFLWGHYWNWDPIETWSLVSWLLVGAVLHLRRSHRLGGRRLAFGAVLCFAGIVAAVWGVNAIETSFHQYEKIR